ncbi:MAG: hypothetical protein FJ403_20490 [Verrucomicrobia bacterium]|nr:hypothetical protein [Verrucomicrobiota bacterium]
MAMTFLITRAADAPQERPRIVAHRGLLKHAPENTLANFRACLELRIGFEFDVRRTRDGHLVCLHDETIDRTTNGTGPVTETRLADLKKLDAGSWFDRVFAGEQIPTIDEIFALAAQYPKADVVLAVDLKGGDNRIEADAVALAKKHKALKRLLFIGRAISFPEVRQRLREADAEAHIAALAESSAEFANALNDGNADWVYLRYIPSRSDLAKVHAAGKRVFIVGPLVAGQQSENWQSAARVGIDAILTDYPLILREALGARQP